MNANDIFTALTGIDEKYIDEAAYELHPGDIATGSEEGHGGKVVDIKSRRRAGKFVKIVLPSVAAIILIVAVALPAVLRVTHNASTSAMSESAAPAAADEAAAEAPAEAESPAAAAEAPAADNFEPIAEAPSVATEEAEEASEDAAVAEAETAGEAAPEDNAYKSARGDEAQMLTAGKGIAVAEADYNDGILTIEFDSDLPAGFADTPYRLTRSDTGEGSLVSEGVLSELSDHIDTEDNRLIIDLTGGQLPTGTYRLSFGDTFAQFEVK